MEIWKDITGFPGYQVSNEGNVRSYINNRHGIGAEAHELRPCTIHTGHKSVQLGRGNRKSVHRLVASEFIPNPDNYPLVRHLDDNPSNNRVENVAWGTQVDNMRDCVQHGRLVGDTRAAIESQKIAVVAISMDGSVEKTFQSMNDAARELGLWPQHVSSALHGKIRQTGGWTFKRLAEVDHE